MPIKSPKKILHITPHFGGGVENALVNYLKESKRDPLLLQRVISLEYANNNALKASKEIGFEIKDKMSSRPAEILFEISKADIVLIHWWNHPLLYDFLVREKLSPCRMIFWSHISGFHSPYVFTKKALSYPDVFVFTTPISLRTREVKKLNRNQKKKLRVIWSTGGVSRFGSIKPKKHSGFNVGYVGTVDYVKMHPNFLKMCAKIISTNFIVCGGPKQTEIKEESIKLGLGKRVDFKGSVPDPAEYLSKFDVFGYPLAPNHYGTCDHSLQEGMAAGIVPVVFSNRMEKSMVRNGKTGIVVKNENEYILAIEKLRKNEKFREKLSLNAKEYALKTYSIGSMVDKWQKVFEEVLAMPKTSKKWNLGKEYDGISASDVFLESLGDYGKSFQNYRSASLTSQKIEAMKEILKLNESTAWRADTRGTVHHYNSFFPGDIYLSFWSKLMKNNKI